MFIRKYWILLSVFILAIAGVGFYLLATHPPPDPIMIYKAVEPLEKLTEQPAAEVPKGETSHGGDFHEDGTWHEGPHDVPPSQKTPGSPIRSTTTEGIIGKIGKFNVFENYMSELPLPNQAELENYWTLETFTETALRYWEEKGGFVGTEFEALTDAEIRHEIQESYQKYLNEHGIPPPPPGYSVVLPQHYSNGRAYYIKENETYVDLTWNRYDTDTDRLSADEWEIYKILKILEPGDTSFTVQPLPEDYAAVARKWAEELEDSTWGPIPALAGGGGVFDISSSSESVNSMSQQKGAEIKKAFEKYWGLPTRPPENGYNIDIQLASWILDEIEDKLAKGDR